MPHTDPGPPGAPAPTKVLRCMEIWGGSHAVEEAVAMPGLVAWVYNSPHRGAADGGDVYYLSLCGGGTITRLVVADVSGHGASVAEFARGLRELMRRNINAKSQARFVAALNRQFLELARMERFATAVVATYLAHRRRLAVCNAGHPRPLWYRADAERWDLLTRLVGEPDADLANLPLGLDGTFRFEPFAVTLGPGDVGVIYTDALIESADASGRPLGEPGLLDLARAMEPPARSPLGVGPALLDGVARHRGGPVADDDVTLLVIHRNGAGPRRPSLGEKLDVYAKVFGLRRL
jgi:sigma-B regulation protein RsbU (phosphoserine phosphatase)